MTAEAILFPDIEAALVTFLGDTLGETVTTRVPRNRPDRFLRVMRVGGVRKNLIADSAMIVVEAWDTDEVEAGLLAARARAFIGALPGSYVAGAWIYRVGEIAGPQAYPDPQSGQPRYVFTVTIDTRGTAI